MISIEKGITKTMQEKIPNAIKIPCFNHALSLSLSEGAKVLLKMSPVSSLDLRNEQLY